MATAKKAQYFISLYVLDQNDRVAEDVFEWQRTADEALRAQFSKAALYIII